MVCRELGAGVGALCPDRGQAAKCSVQSGGRLGLTEPIWATRGWIPPSRGLPVCHSQALFLSKVCPEFFYRRTYLITPECSSFSCFSKCQRNILKQRWLKPSIQTNSPVFQITIFICSFFAEHIFLFYRLNFLQLRIYLLYNI